MDYQLRVVVEKVSLKTHEVMQKETLVVYDVVIPESILDLGLRHTQQMELLQKIQEALIQEQTPYLNPDYQVCPKCQQRMKKNGYQTSNFHAVFSDHKIKLQKHLCTNPECDLHITPSIKSLLGSNSHPDLAKLQCEQGALHSYREAQNNLAKLNSQRRRINNHTQIKTVTNQVGAVLAAENYSLLSPEECATPATEMIVQVDGGHIPIKDQNQRSFEALAAIVYRPENLQVLDRHHRQIREKTCVISAQSDRLQTIKTYVVNAAYKQGLSRQTNITALADGAHNCWSVISVLEPRCQDLQCILDWFHISRKFQKVHNALLESKQEVLESVKWRLWHGQAEEALSKLESLQNEMSDASEKSQLQSLGEYLQRNRAYLINYQSRKQRNQTYTSQVAESHIETLINARHKKKGKMQWTREGAHRVLQIRASMASGEWNRKWQKTVMKSMGVGA